MRRDILQNEEWTKILTFLRQCPGVYVGKEAKCREFMDGVLWVTRSGGQWRLLPERFGKWNSVYKRFVRWCTRGVWQGLLAHFATDPAMENVLLDTTIVRAHPSAAGAPHRRGGQASQALGRSRGGFSTKIHIIVDAHGQPLRFRLTGGQRHDLTQAPALIADLEFDHVIADRSYDSDDFLKLICTHEAQAVIPPRANRRLQREYDTERYRERNLVERFVNKIKQYRRVFSRFDKLDLNYLGFLSFVGALIWLR